MEFGAKIARELDNLIATSRQFTFDEDGDREDGQAIWSSWEWDDVWSAAHMPELVAYLYGSNDLEIPSSWKPLLPRTL